MKNNKSKLVDRFIIVTFVSLYLIVSLISTIHVVDFFRISNPDWLAVSLAIAFEIGAAASLASLIVLEKMNRGMVWILFILLTAMQAMGNTYYAYINLEDFQSWSELFGLIEEEEIYQKRLLSIISGAILPVIALGFIKSLVDYIKPDDTPVSNPNLSDATTEKPQEKEQKINQAEQADSEGNIEDLAVEINEPLVSEFSDVEMILDKEDTGSEITEINSLSDLPDYRTPIIHSNQEVVNVNQNKNTDSARIRPNIIESPDSLDMNPTRIR